MRAFIYDHFLKLAIATSITILLIVYGMDLFSDAAPCKLCIYQRYPHIFIIAFCLTNLALLKWIKEKNTIILSSITISSLAYFTNFLLSGYHFGVEEGWFESLMSCNVLDIPMTSPEELLKIIQSRKPTSCDIPQFEILGLSLALYHSIINLALSALSFTTLIYGIKKNAKK